MRGQLEKAEKAAPGKRLSFGAIVYGLSLIDEVTDTPLGPAANGYLDALAPAGALPSADRAARARQWCRETRAEFGLLFNPFVDSFKRLDPDLFVATRATWGTDNRHAACRAILSVPADVARVESRRPGADANRTSSPPGCWPVACTACATASPLVREYLGPELAANFLAIRRAEHKAFDTWCRTSVSKWELACYRSPLTGLRRFRLL